MRLVNQICHCLAVWIGSVRKQILRLVLMNDGPYLVLYTIFIVHPVSRQVGCLIWSFLCISPYLLRHIELCWKRAWQYAQLDAVFMYEYCITCYLHCCVIEIFRIFCWQCCWILRSVCIQLLMINRHLKPTVKHPAVMKLMMNCNFLQFIQRYQQLGNFASYKLKLKGNETARYTVWWSVATMSFTGSC
jgi:hypothetical protein